MSERDLGEGFEVLGLRCFKCGVCGIEGLLHIP